MLYNFFMSFKFHSFCQSGCYFDFFYKKFSEVFMSNVFVYSSQFLGEKYMMEVLTKKIMDKSMFSFNKYIGWNNLKYFNFFFNFLMVFFYFVGLINVLLFVL